MKEFDLILHFKISECSKTAEGNDEFMRPKFESKQDLSSIALPADAVDMTKSKYF